MANHHPADSASAELAMGGREPRLRNCLFVRWPACGSASPCPAGLLVQVVLIGVALLNLVLSWTVVNTVFTLHYADQHSGLGRAGIDFNDSDAEEPHVPRLRPRRLHHRHVLPVSAQSADSPHALPRLLSYVFGAATVGGSVNLIAGLIH